MNVNTTPEVKHLPKALRLSGILSTLPDRVSYAAGTTLRTRSSLNWSWSRLTTSTNS